MMRRAHALLSIVFVAATCGVAIAQEGVPQPPPPGARPPIDPKERWERMTPEERARLAERFDRWKHLPPEQQREMQERHHALRRTREEAIRRLPPPERERLKQMSPEERRRFLEGQVERVLPEVRDDMRRPPAGGTPESGSFRDLRAAVRGYATERLREFERQGVLRPGEAEHLLSLAPWQLPDEIRGLKKRDVLANPPPAFQMLPPDERARIAELPPEAFLDEMHRLSDGKRDRGPRGRARDVFDRMRQHGGPDRDGRDGRGGPRPILPRQLADHLTPEQRAQIEAAHGRDRIRLIGEFLMERARAALMQRGEDPKAVDALSGLDGYERDRRLLKLIDPNAELPPPPMQGRGEGGPPGPGGPPDGHGSEDDDRDGRDWRDGRDGRDRHPDQRWD